jgi:hypothetical protein
MYGAILRVWHRLVALIGKSLTLGRVCATPAYSSHDMTLSNARFGLPDIWFFDNFTSPVCFLTLCRTTPICNRNRLTQPTETF